MAARINIKRLTVAYKEVYDMAKSLGEFMQSDEVIGGGEYHGTAESKNERLMEILQVGLGQLGLAIKSAQKFNKMNKQPWTKRRSKRFL